MATTHFHAKNRALTSTLPALLLLMLAASGCAASGYSFAEKSDEINATHNHSEPLVLIPGDTLQVEFPRFPEYSHQARIDSDGFATFRRLGRTRCAGVTLRELERKLLTEYERVFEQPELNAFVLTPAPKNVMVIGEVIRPGAVLIPHEGITLLEALALAGGPRRETASIKNVLLVRYLEQEQRRAVWCLDIRPDNWEQTPVIVAPRDILMIPPKPIVKVNTWIDQYVRRMLPIPVTTGSL